MIAAAEFHEHGGVAVLVFTANTSLLDTKEDADCGLLGIASRGIRYMVYGVMKHYPKSAQHSKSVR